jgi:hypothetical protein
MERITKGGLQIVIRMIADHQFFTLNLHVDADIVGAALLVVAYWSFNRYFAINNVFINTFKL